MNDITNLQFCGQAPKLEECRSDSQVAYTSYQKYKGDVKVLIRSDIDQLTITDRKVDVVFSTFRGFLFTITLRQKAIEVLCMRI